jgi:hypothetical protein
VAYLCGKVDRIVEYEFVEIINVYAPQVHVVEKRVG